MKSLQKSAEFLLYFHFFIVIFWICSVYISDWKDPFRNKVNNVFSVSIIVRIKSHEIKVRKIEGTWGKILNAKHPLHPPKIPNTTLEQKISKKNEVLQLISEKKKGWSLLHWVFKEQIRQTSLRNGIGWVDFSLKKKQGVGFILYARFQIPSLELNLLLKASWMILSFTGISIFFYVDAL